MSLKENHGITELKRAAGRSTTNIGKKGGFETPEEAEKVTEYEKDTKKQRNLRLQKCKRQM